MKPLNHLAVIPDGNRRWAEKNKKIKKRGHYEGMKRIVDTASWSVEKDINYLTFFVFSTENFNRDKKEVDYLMNLLFESLKGDLVDKMNKKGVRLNFLGKKEELPKKVRDALDYSLKKTRENSKMCMSLAINYGGRAEVLDAVNQAIKKGEAVDEESFEDYLWSSDLPDIDLMIRAGKERRISNFLLWKLSYSELYFSQKLWPDFDEDLFNAIIEDYYNRQRRFGR